MTDEFLGIFQYLQRQRKPIDLVSMFKGLPVVSNVYLLHVSSFGIVVKPEENQLVCLYADRQAFIRHELFPRPVLANVEEIDLLNREVTLHDFSYTGPGIGNRGQLRIQPEKLVMSVMQTLDEGEAISGHMVDLSSEGLAIYVNQPELPDVFSDIGTQVKVSLRLPVFNTVPYQQTEVQPPSDEIGFEQPESENRDDVELFAVVVNTQMDAAHGWYRIGLRLAPWHTANEALLSFISLRQKEIISDLRNRYIDLLRG